MQKMPTYEVPVTPKKGKKLAQYRTVSVFSYPPSAGAAETSIVQPWWNKVIGFLPNDLPVELTDEHKHPTIGTRKPGQL